MLSFKERDIWTVFKLEIKMNAIFVKLILFVPFFSYLYRDSINKKGYSVS